MPVTLNTPQVPLNSKDSEMMGIGNENRQCLKAKGPCLSSDAQGVVEIEKPQRTSYDVGSVEQQSDTNLVESFQVLSVIQNYEQNYEQVLVESFQVQWKRWSLYMETRERLRMSNILRTLRKQYMYRAIKSDDIATLVYITYANTLESFASSLMAIL
ncbi:uncharacterized protein HKW66_Vig0147400 [Vigna angularis]|uniref:Uncharacterized protein n=1 Tax=Phaseolus angularis TaxID=3914 RepID=A0A8T0JV60_PHAAN|nr:uncharacterized protein HKW66_Vig0147400 [Vigna angularis]